MNSEASDQGVTPKEAGILIYVVDDQKAIGWVVEGILSLYNYRVAYFEDPREALNAFKQAENKPQLLISDYVMNAMNGLELIDACKKVCPVLRTILYSGSVTEELSASAPTRPNAFLSKPFQAHELIETVRRALA